MFDEEALREKLRRVEALHAGATTPAERDVAANAMGKIQQRLRLLENEDPPVEFRFTMPDAWSRRLFVALARRCGLKPYRYQRQRHNTVMVRVRQGSPPNTDVIEVVRIRVRFGTSYARVGMSLGVGGGPPRRDQRTCGKVGGDGTLTSLSRPPGGEATRLARYRANSGGKFWPGPCRRRFA